MGLRQWFELSQGLFNGQAGPVHDLVGFTQSTQGLRAEAAPFQPFGIDSMRRRRMTAGDHDIGRDIFGDGAAHPAKAVCAEDAKLMHQGKSPQNGVITDTHMTGQGGAVGEDGLVSYQAIVGDVHVGHDPVVVADPGYAASLRGAAVEGAVFADDVAVTDLQCAVFARIFFILRRLAEGGELEYLVVPADARGAVYNDVRSYPGAIADLHLRADDGIGAHLNPRPQFRAGINNGPFVYHTGISFWVHIRSASATTFPLTLASPVNCTSPRTLRFSSTSRIS